VEGCDCRGRQNSRSSWAPLAFPDSYKTGALPRCVFRSWATVKLAVDNQHERPGWKHFGEAFGPNKDVLLERAATLARNWSRSGISKVHEFATKILRRVVMGARNAWIEVDKAQLVAILLRRNSDDPALCTGAHGVIQLVVELNVIRRRGELRVISPYSGPSPEQTPTLSLVKAIARARVWYEQIISGEVCTVDQIAKQAGLSGTYVRRVLRCATLSPNVVEATLLGTIPPSLTVEQLLRDMPLSLTIISSVPKRARFPFATAH
jgi:hypothetical protein